jgi:hypothetical protein
MLLLMKQKLISTTVLFLLACLTASTSHPLKLDRAIIATDANPMYLEFWPIVAKAWKEIVGIKPTLVFVAPLEIPIDETLGDVIRFEPIPDIPTAFQAQVIRLLIPILFEDEVCILSDMDMIPLQRDYFVKFVANIPADSFVIYKDGAFPADVYTQYPMCYNAALGSTFKEIFKINGADEIRQRIQAWYNLGLGWTSDQQILYYAIRFWCNKETRCVMLHHDVIGRVDRACWNYNKFLLKNNGYVDAHMLRPYSKFKQEIDALAADLGLGISQ